MNSYRFLTKANVALNNYKKAYEYLKLFSALNDSTQRDQGLRNRNELAFKYELENKEKQIEILSKESEIQQLKISKNHYIIYGLIGIILLIITIAALVLKQLKLKGEQQSIVLKQKLLRSQMNPHFIFNSLNAIQSFIFKSDVKESGKYLAKFARLMRLIMENSREEYISIEKEITTLDHYLQLQQLRFENKFNFSLDVDSQIDLERTAIPPMLAQPFIENSLEHGIFSKEGQGQVDIRFKLENNYIVFEVEDNGVGRKKANELKELKQENHKSLATSITQERITMLNKRNRKKIEITINDLKNTENVDCGTQVIFHIPIKIL